LGFIQVVLDNVGDDSVGKSKPKPKVPQVIA
jgi:hypothetical protein